MRFAFGLCEWLDDERPTLWEHFGYCYSTYSVVVEGPLQSQFGIYLHSLSDVERLPLPTYLGNTSVHCHLVQPPEDRCTLYSQPIKYLFLLLRLIRTQAPPAFRIRGSTASVMGAYTMGFLDSTDLTVRRYFESSRDNFENHLCILGNTR